MLFLSTGESFYPVQSSGLISGRLSGYFFSEVCPDDNSKMVIVSSMKFSEVHITVPKYIPIDFGDDLDIRPDMRPNKLS